MPAPGRSDAHPPPLQSRFSVQDLSAVGIDVWAVGMRGAPAPAVVAHSTGGQPWRVESYSSSTAAAHTQLVGTHAVAVDDVWAVGWEGILQSGAERTHIAHRDGATWRPVAGPDLGGGSHLSAVAAWGRDDAFAVGARGVTSPSPSAPLGLPPVALWASLGVRWDGTRWAAVTGPARGTLHGVCAVGPGAYWAVGATALDERPGNISVVARYADEHWQEVGYEGVGPLFGVAATGPDDVWAVGQNQDPGHPSGVLILHYDGRGWERSEAPVSGQAWLSDVACAGPDRVWAVGTRQRSDGGFGPLILHFDGSAWAVVEPPATAAPNGLSAVVALPDGSAWAAAGFSSAGDAGYLIPAVPLAPGVTSPDTGH